MFLRLSLLLSLLLSFPTSSSSALGFEADVDGELSRIVAIRRFAKRFAKLLGLLYGADDPDNGGPLADIVDGVLDGALDGDTCPFETGFFEKRAERMCARLEGDYRICSYESIYSSYDIFEDAPGFTVSTQFGATADEVNTIECVDQPFANMAAFVINFHYSKGPIYNWSTDEPQFIAKWNFHTEELVGVPKNNVGDNYHAGKRVTCEFANKRSNQFDDDTLYCAGTLLAYDVEDLPGPFPADHKAKLPGHVGPTERRREMAMAFDGNKSDNQTWYGRIDHTYASSTSFYMVPYDRPCPCESEEAGFEDIWVQKAENTFN